MEIIISPGHAYWVKRGQPALQHGAERVERVECLAGRGLRGDRYAEKRCEHKGQVTLMSSLAVDEIRQHFGLPDLPSTVFRRNLIVSDIDLAPLVGQRFHIQDIEFEGTEECLPCRWMDRVVAEGARTFMKENFRGGLRAKLLSDGVLVALQQASD